MRRFLFSCLSSLLLMACLESDPEAPSTRDAESAEDAEADAGMMDGDMPADTGGAGDRGPGAPGVGWCSTQFPATLEVLAGGASPSVYGRVYVEGCTDGPATCSGVEMAFGVGPVDQDPSVDPSSWQWTAAVLNEAYAEDNNDEYSAIWNPQTAGEFAYAFRAKRGDEPWTYCDLGGSDDGFALGETGRATVTDADSLVIGWCAIQHPQSTSVALGGPSEPIYGQVFVEGCTEGAGRCDAVTGQVGLGAAGSLPDETWRWVDAAYNEAVVEGANDEYSAALAPPEPGDFAYAYRFRLGDEGAWVLCGTDGADAPLSVESLGTVNVAARPIEWCNLQFPETLEGAVGDEVGPVYGRVYSPQCTDGAGRCWGLRMQVGAGPADVSPADTPDAFAWVDGAYNPGHIDDDNDEFSATFTLSSDDARFLVRFSGDGGETWTLCDGGGSPFDPAEMGTITRAP